MGGGGGGGDLGTYSASTYLAMMYKYFRLWVYCDLYAIMTTEWLIGCVRHYETVMVSLMCHSV